MKIKISQRVIALTVLVASFGAFASGEEKKDIKEEVGFVCKYMSMLCLAQTRGGGGGGGKQPPEKED